MGVKNYNNDQQSSKIKKDALDNEEIEEIAQELIDENPTPEEQTKILNNALDKILVTHRNSRIFLFMLTGPFFAFFMIFKYSIKAVILTYLWRKRKREAASKKLAEENAAGSVPTAAVDAIVTPGSNKV